MVAGAADLRDMLATVDVLTLLLYRDEDARAALDVDRAINAAIPGSTLMVMPGVGNVSTVEAPDLTRKLP